MKSLIQTTAADAVEKRIFIGYEVFAREERT
jgi:hypothetical protein